jgi:16S rRNA (adenine1518-N6/adenine1519-N6)-dimethyltransferase
VNEKLTSPRVVRETLARLGASPSKALGQNFLIDANIVDIAVRAADVRPGDTVLEIGPGLGVLTDALAEQGASVVAVEMDRTFVKHLQERFAGDPRVAVIGGDFLEQDIPALLESRGIDKMAANLPYNTGTRMLVELILAPRRLRTIVATVQLEVGERLAAVPGDDAYGMLSVWAGVDYRVELVKKISPTCFFPPPTVWSVLTRLTVRDPGSLTRRRASPLFYTLTRLAFQHRRKQLAGIFDRAPGPMRLEPAVTAGLLEGLGVPAKARAEELSVEQWLELADRIAALKSKQEQDHVSHGICG